MTTRYPVKFVAPPGTDVVAALFRTDGTTAAVAYTTETGSTPTTQPLTVTEGTTATMWVPEGAYSASSKVSTVEMAGGYLLQKGIYANGQNVISVDLLVLAANVPGAGAGGAVASVNTQTGVVVLTASDVSAQPVDTDLTAIAALTSAANKVPYATGAAAWALADLTAAGRALIDDADAAAQRTTLGVDAAGILTLVKTVDGTGSGLDADTLKGVDASLFVVSGSIGTKKYVGSSDGTTPAWVSLPVEIGVALSDETTAITTGTAKATIRMPFAMTLTSVRANLNTASSSGLPTVNIKETGTTIFSTKVTIDATEKTSTTAATPAVISDTALADDAEITFDIDVAGTGAKGLKVWLIGVRA